MLTLIQRIMISAPKNSIRLYLRDLENLPRYSRRIAQVEIISQDDRKAVIAASGRFFAVPWKSSFEAAFNEDGGLVLSMSRGPFSEMISSYSLRPVSGGTILTHEENYRLPVLLRPLGILLRRFIAETMDLELRAVKEGAERLNRQIKLREIEAAL
ncbi:MAG: SRPBCC family protein [Elusimicrobiota bacterium]